MEGESRNRRSRGPGSGRSLGPAGAISAAATIAWLIFLPLAGAAGAELTGRVTDGTDGIEGVTVRASFSPGPSSETTTSSSNGSFSLDLPEAEVLLEFDTESAPSGSDAKRFFGTSLVVVMASDPLDLGDVVLTEAASVQGRVSDDGGDPVPAAQVNIAIPGAGVDRDLETGPDGRFELDRIRLSQQRGYSLVITTRPPPDGGDPPDLHFGSARLESDELAPGVDLTGLDLQLATGGRIHGTTEPGEGSDSPPTGPRHLVRFIAEDGAWSTARARGTYLGPVLAPGIYLVRFDGSLGDRPLYWAGAGQAPALAMSGAQPVEVTAGSIVTGIDRTGQFGRYTAPANDDFAHSAPLRQAEPGVWTAAGQTQGAGFEAGDPMDPAASESDAPAVSGGGGSVWWWWRAPESGVYTLEKAGSDPGLKVGVFRGNRVDRLAPVPATVRKLWHDGVAQYEFTAEAGGIYRIATAVGEPGPELAGNVVLNLVQGWITGGTMLGARPVLAPDTGEWTNGEGEYFGTGGLDFSAVFLDSQVVFQFSSAECRLDGTPVTCAGGPDVHSYSPPSPLTGTHLFEVRLTTQAGYRDPTPARAWFHDGPPDPACANSLDDDGDGGIDYPEDPGCARDTDLSESNPESQPADSDLDGVVESDDECPYAPGPAERAGCPEPGPTGPTGPTAATGPTGPTGPARPGAKAKLALRVSPARVRLGTGKPARLRVTVRNLGASAARRIVVCGRGPAWTRPARFCRRRARLGAGGKWRFPVNLSRRRTARTGLTGRYRLRIRRPGDGKLAVVRLGA